MSSESPATLLPGQRIQHAEFGEGVVVTQPTNGFVRVFFGGGERQVPVTGLMLALSRTGAGAASCRSRGTESKTGLAVLPGPRLTIAAKRRRPNLSEN